MIPSPRVNTSQTSVSQTVPAPTGGLNGRDSLADMDRKDAYLMDNIFPGAAACESRRGCEKYSSAALAGAVQSLEVYSGGGTEKMLAMGAGKIYDVSTSIANQLATGLTGNSYISTMFSNAGSQFLILCNGLDQTKSYNGAALANLVQTGVTGSANTLSYVFSFKGRLYWAQKDQLGFYYLPVGAIQGAMSYFDLTQVASKGGYLVAIASFSDSTAGSGSQDYIVFITSTGEYIVYAGYDPSASASWELVGRYYSAPPIGRKCTINYGTELLILTSEGAIPFSLIRRAGDAKSQGVTGAEYKAITSKLGKYLSVYNDFSTVPGWQGLLYSRSGWLLLNVPATALISGKYYQFVMNTVTGAWCRFQDWNGLCFAVYGGRLYFGRYDGYVMLADEGRLDDTADIKINVKTAYDYFEDGSGLGMLQKHFQWASMLVSCDGTPPLSGAFSTDFKERQPDYITVVDEDPSGEWDTAIWDLATWATDEETQRVVLTLNISGIAGSLWLRATLSGLTFSWYATQYVMQKTRGLLI